MLVVLAQLETDAFAVESVGYIGKRPIFFFQTESF